MKPYTEPPKTLLDIVNVLSLAKDPLLEAAKLMVQEIDEDYLSSAMGPWALDFYRNSYSLKAGIAFDYIVQACDAIKECVAVLEAERQKKETKPHEARA